MRHLMLTIAALTLLPVMSMAAEAGLARPTFLPADAQILQALESSPALLEARAQFSGAQAESRMLTAGEHETLFTGSFDERRVRGDRSYGEWSAQASRGLRLPGKAALDRAAGAAGVKAAHNAIDDARHQSSLILADRWIAWAQAAERQKIDAAEAESYAREVTALERRVVLQDASLLDLQTAQAALARARAVLALSSGGEQTARAALDAHFPGLAPARPADLPAPTAPTRPLDQWRDVIIERSHEVTIARALADREAFLARRARFDRMPDPIIGVRTFNERGGDESGVGVFVSIPISGARRSAASDRQAAEAAAAEARYAMVARDVRATAIADVLAAESSLQAWRQARSALEASDQAAAKIRRAYELGERDLAERLAGDRLAFEARRGELSARADAHRSLLTLALDAHELWLADED